MHQVADRLQDQQEQGHASDDIAPVILGPSTPAFDVAQPRSQIGNLVGDRNLSLLDI
jgi:hypothetical protein